jgi:hypothetical protein
MIRSDVSCGEKRTFLDPSSERDGEEAESLATWIRIDFGGDFFVVDVGTECPLTVMDGVLDDPCPLCTPWRPRALEWDSVTTPTPLDPSGSTMGTTRGLEPGVPAAP